MSAVTPPLPELTDAVVDVETLERLFADLGALTEVQHVIVRARAGVRASTADVRLDEARARLLAREVDGVQVLYRWEGATWRDAILATPGGFRVVRMRVG